MANDDGNREAREMLCREGEGLDRRAMIQRTLMAAAVSGSSFAPAVKAFAQSSGKMSSVCKECAVVSDTPALSGSLLGQVQTSPVTSQFQSSLSVQGWELNLLDGIETVFDFRTPGVIPADAQHAVVPVISENGDFQGVYVYAMSVEASKEGAEFIRPYATDIDPNGRTVRIFTTPGLDEWVDLIYDFTVLSPDGCNPGIEVIGGGMRSSDKNAYTDCLLNELLVLLLAGHTTGANEFCVTACAAGGIANPVCVTCLLSLAGCTVAIWWGC